MKALLFCVLTLLCLQLIVEVSSYYTGRRGYYATRDERMDEVKLVEYLHKTLKEQGSFTRPVLQAKDNVTVEVGLTLLRLQPPQGNWVDVDVYVRLDWQDPRLTWDLDTSRQKQFGNVTSIVLPANSIWLPDIGSESVFGLKLDREASLSVFIHNDGRINYGLPARARFDCGKPTPSGIYNCEMKLNSWSYHAEQVDIRLEENALELSMLQTNEWVVSDSKAVRNELVYPCCPWRYVSAAFNISVAPFRRS